MSVETIDSLDDPRVACYRNLKDRELARAGGLFIAEGELLVRRLLASPFPTESVLLSERRAAEVLPVIPAGVQVYVAADALVHQVLGFHFHSGVMACGRRVEGPTVEGVMEGTPDYESGRAKVEGGSSGGRPPDYARSTRSITLAICPDTANTRNLGAIIRVCAAFGVEALVLGQYCCDPFYRQSVRISMGAVFALPIVRSADLLADLKLLRDKWGVELAATVLDPTAEPLDGAGRGPRLGLLFGGEAQDRGARGAELFARLGLLFGGEAQGLGEPWLSACTRRLTIPMHWNTDSLNVAVAAGVFLYHFTRRNHKDTKAGEEAI